MSDTGIAEFDSANFDSDVLAQDGLVLVDYWSEGCVPCKQLARVLQQLRTEIGPEVKIGSVKVDDNAALSERYGVRTSPTLLFFKSGTVVASRTGDDRRQVINKLIEEYS
jgi:thioredoxin 1